MPTVIELKLNQNAREELSQASAELEEFMAVMDSAAMTERQYAESMQETVTITGEETAATQSNAQAIWEKAWAADAAFRTTVKLAGGLETAVRSAIRFERFMSAGGTAALGATIAWKTFASVLNQTGVDEAIIRVEDATEEQNEAWKKLAETAKKEGKTIQQALEDSGQSLEDFGRHYQTNLDRIEDATAGLGDRITRPVTDAISNWWNATNIFADAWESFDKRLTEWTDNAVRNTGHVADAYDELRARAAEGWGKAGDDYLEEIRMLNEMRKSSEAVAAAHERQRPYFELLKNTNLALEAQIARQQELKMIAEARSAAELKDMEANFKGMAGEEALGERFDEAAAERLAERITAIRAREEALERESRARLDREWEAHVEKRKRQDDELTQRRQRNREEGARAREEELQREHEARDAEADHTRTLESEERRAWHEQFRARLDLQTQTLEKEFQGEKTTAARRKQIIAELRTLRQTDFESRMRQIEEETRLTVDNANTQLEKRRAQMDGERKASAEVRNQRIADMRAEAQAAAELAELERQRAAEKAAREKQLRAEAQAARAEAIQNQAGGTGAPSFAQQLAQMQEMRAVLQQIAQQRFEAARTSGMSDEEQARLRRGINRQVMGQAQQGQIDPAEFQQASRNLAQQQTEVAAQTGQIGRAAADAIKADFNRTNELIREAEAARRDIEALKAGAEGQSQRVRAIRGGLR